MRLAASALAAVCLVPATGPGLAFAPEEGSALSKRFTWTVATTSNDSSLSIGESEMPASDGITTVRTYELAVRDVYAKLAAGRPARLERKYETILANRDSENVPEGVVIEGLGEHRGPLEGHAAVFTLDEESGEYEARLAEGDDGDDAWLDEAREDLDLRGLLPDVEMVVGESWEVDPTALQDLLSPGGDLGWEPEDKYDHGDDDPGSISINVPSVDQGGLFEHYQGDVVATFEGSEGDLWTIALEVSLEADADVTDDLNDELADQGSDQQYGEVAVTGSLEGAGKLVWNGARGTFESFAFEGETESTIEAAWVQDFGSNEVDLSFSESYAGSLEVAHSTGE